MLTLNVEGVEGVSAAVTIALQRDRHRPRDLERHLRAVCKGGEELEGADGWAVANNIVSVVAGQLPLIVGGCNGLVLFSALRHLSPSLWLSAPLTHEACRGVAETTVHRSADWSTIPDEGDCWSFPPRIIEVLADLSAASMMLVTALSARRRIAKGQRVSVRRLVPLEFRRAQGAIADLIEVRDTRVMNDRNALAGVSGLSVVAGEHNHRVLAAEWVSTEEFHPVHGPAASAERGEVAPLPGDVARQGFRADLDDRDDQLTVVNDALETTLQFGFAALDVVYEAVTAKIIQTYPVGCRSMADHGWALGPTPTATELRAAARVVARRGKPRPSPESVRRAFDAVDAGQADNDVTKWRHQRAFRRIGDSILYDLVKSSPLPLHLIESDLPHWVAQKLEKGFESRVHGLIGQLGTQPFRTGEVLRRQDGTLITDLDACVAVGKVLFVADCYASPWRQDLDDGDHASTRNRAERLVKKLRAWDGKWKEVTRTAPNLLPAGVSLILPVVVTPGAEWIGSPDGDLWFSPGIPRICTATELMDLIHRGVDADTPGVIEV